ncbi:hypothetical protein [Streptomyces sp. BE133]|uniref:hypothetical protein n=1 Tax=Streptomyces sp. BE133 TaxID=3002523 RepID=UPI002E7990BB|nr:hypothetical protein [Streptomyces sp. BE133]MEE1811591.1 hypothetical protein [Streptomyces sp. BE133]
MHPDTHLLMHHQRAAELRQRAAELHLAPTASRTGLRTRLGWVLVELGLRVLSRHPGRTSVAPGTA